MRPSCYNRGRQDRPGKPGVTVAASIGPIRPPSEAYSLLIRVTENCPWNRCAFCSAYKGQTFRVRPLEEVRADILAARRLADEVALWAGRGGLSVGAVARANGLIWLGDDGVKSAFLQDSDSLVVRTDQLVAIIELLREAFPELERVCSYTRGKTLARKRMEDLVRLRRAGLTRVHVGLETGDDELLAYISKGATAREMVEGGRKAVAAGLEVSEYVMPGLGGKERWHQHAENSARVLNQINPHFIRLRTFHPIPGTPMHDRMLNGEYHLQTVVEVLTEVRRLVECLEVSSELIAGDYAWNAYLGNVDGRLPDEKAAVLAGIDRALAHWRERGEPGRRFLRRALN